MTKKRSDEIRRVMAENPACTVKVGDVTLTHVTTWKKHKVIWIDYAGRVSEIDLGPRGAKVIA